MDGGERKSVYQLYITVFIMLFTYRLGATFGETTTQQRTTVTEAYTATAETPNATSSNFVVIASQAVYPGQPYTVSITILQSTDVVSVTASLRGSNDGLIASGSVGINAESMDSIKLQIPRALADSSYVLEVEGSGGLTFVGFHDVYVPSKALSIFVQTDKAVYIQSQKVMFRVVTMHLDTTPYTNIIDIAVYDSKENKLMQWLNQSSTNGVWNNSLQLSNVPTPGKWTIEVIAQDYRFEKTFDVAELELSAFEVEADVPLSYWVNMYDPGEQDDMSFTLRATYTFGRPVTGTAKVTVGVQLNDWEIGWYSTVSGSNTRTYSVSLVDGSATVSVTAADLYQIVPSYSTSSDYNIWSSMCWRRILVNASVTETHSGKVGHSSKAIQSRCYYNVYSLTFVNTPMIFRPGFAFSGELTLSRQDGKPLPASAHNSEITLSAYCYDMNWNYIQLPTQQLQVPVTRIVSFSVDLAGYQCYQYPYLQASFSDVNGSYASAYKDFSLFYTRDNEAIQVVLADTQTTIMSGSTVTFVVSSTNAISSFAYQLLSKDIIVKSALVKESSATVHYLSINIDTQLSWKLSPSARIVVWFVTTTGELVADNLDFSVVAALPNQVSAAFSSGTVQPGNSVTITVTASPGSYVGLLVVNQAAARATGNDIRQENVMDELFSFHNESRCLGLLDGVRSKRDVVTTISTATDSAHVFFVSGVFAITDAFLKNENNFDTSCQPLSNPVPREDKSNDTIDPAVAGFLETWLWDHAVASSAGTATFQVTIPDRVASWMLTAFAVSATSGLGVVQDPVNITATKSFFLSFVAPFVVIRGEEFGFQVTANNIGTTSFTTVITLPTSSSYNVRLPTFLEPASVDATITLQVPGHGSVTAEFWIVPVVLGEIQLVVSAVANEASDTITCKVIVKPEGIAQEYNMAVSGSPEGGQPFTHIFNVTLPGEGILVPGSPYIIISAIGNFIGQSIDGLGNLLHMPCGCGEQTMIYFAPDVYILKYLRATDQNTPELEQLAMSYMVSGYQRELTYQHPDGSFSAFGSRDAKGSLWLSAFVGKCFSQAQDFISIDFSNLGNTFRWIISNQQADGSFVEPGIVYHADMQGLASHGKPLTVFVLISMEENGDNPQVAAEISTAVTKTIQYVEGLLTYSTVTSDPYLMNLICYALTLASRSTADKCLTLLQDLATTTEEGLQFWHKESFTCTSRWSCYWYQPLAIDVEMTAYALLTYTKLGDVVKCGAISKWLMEQRNSNGGFISTQDTVIALQALSEYAGFLAGSGGGQNAVVTLTANSNNQFTHTFDTITSVNSLLLQRVEIPADATEIDCEISGVGVALIQMTVKYYVYNLKSGDGKRRRRRFIVGQSSSFIQVRADQEQLSDTKIMLTVCASWTGTGESGMVMMEIGVPTGYMANDPTLLLGQGEGRVKHAELDPNTKQLSVYIDELIDSDTCVNVTLTKVLPVTKVKKARVTVYLYYNPAERTIYEYESQAESNDTSHCDQCPTCCECNPPDYFKCGETCLAVSAKCNGISECADKSDEIGCPTITTTTKKPTSKKNNGRRRRKCKRRRGCGKKMRMRLIRKRIKRLLAKRRARNAKMK